MSTDLATKEDREPKSEPTVFTRSNKKCSYCLAFNPDVKRCMQCKMVQYCSKECQRNAWKTHKKACQTSGTALKKRIETDKWAAQLNTELSKWLDFWRMPIHGDGIHVMDLANHPPGRLATHVWVLILKRDTSINLQAFRMKCTKADIWSREQLCEYLRYHDTPEDMIDDWYTDNRGDHVLHTAVLLEPEGTIRFMWINYRSLDMYMKRSKVESRRIAKETKEKLVTAMNGPPGGAEMLEEYREGCPEHLSEMFTKVLKR